MVRDLPSTKEKQRVWLERIIRILDYEAMHIAAAGLLRPGFDEARADIRLLYEQLFNRKGPRGRSVSDPITPAKIREVFRARDEHPNWSQQEIAYATNVNIGRVSEILHGKRT